MGQKYTFIFKLQKGKGKTYLPQTHLSGWLSWFCHLPILMKSRHKRHFIHRRGISYKGPDGHRFVSRVLCTFASRNQLKTHSPWKATLPPRSPLPPSAEASRKSPNGWPACSATRPRANSAEPFGTFSSPPSPSSPSTSSSVWSCAPSMASATSVQASDTTGARKTRPIATPTATSMSALTSSTTTTTRAIFTTPASDAER